MAVDLISAALSLSELTDLVGYPPGPSSHDRGEKRALGKVWDQSIWRLSSGAGDEAGLEEHLEELRQRAEQLGLFEAGRVPADVVRVLNVAVISDSASSTTMFPSSLLRPFVRAGFDLDVTVYPATAAPADQSEEGG